MTHDELLAKIDSYLIPTKAYSDEPNFAIKVLQALRAVVKLHYPKSTGIGFTDLICRECSGLDALDYPCPTIQVIEKELE